MIQDSKRTPLNELLAGLQPSQQGFAVSVPADWMQGRAIYGGLSAVLCLVAGRRVFPELPPLRSAQLTFIGPAGADVELVPTKLRQGKSAAFINVDLNSEGRTAVRANLCFGARRESRFDNQTLDAPKVPRVADCQPFFPEGAGPNFAGHFNSRRAGGQALVSGARTGDLCAWVQHKDNQSRESIEGLVALADALPPAAMALFNEPAPVSTMTWQFDVVADPPETRDGWWLCRSTTQTVRDGYSSQEMAVWSTQGQPVVIGRQNVAVFT